MSSEHGNSGNLGRGFGGEDLLARLRHLLGVAAFGGDDGLPTPFMAFVDYLVQNPQPRLPLAVGENGISGATSDLFWSYSRQGGLHLEAKAGFLATATGNGGFSLDVAPDGTWRLHFAGSTVRIGSGAATPPPPPPAGNTLVGIENGTAVHYDASAGGLTVDGTRPAAGAANPVPGNDTIFAGVRDYLIGGSPAHQVAAVGDPNGNVGNCVIFTAAKNSSVPAGSVLVDMQNGRGYGSNAEGNVYVDINQVRGSLQSNVLIGNATGTDLKSGGGNSVLISTGGDGYELRPDGSGNVLVATIGRDRVLFDPQHGWKPGDQTTMLGFESGNAAYLDLSLLGATIHDPAAAGFNPLTGMGNINDYVKLAEAADGEHVLFSAAGQVNISYVDLVDLKLTHGLTADGLLAHGGLVI